MLHGLKKATPTELYPAKSELCDQIFFDDVITGLSQRQKQLSPKYFYDKQGSEYFDRICDLREYYPYKAELALLPKVAKELQAVFEHEQAIIEFGAGSLQKIKPLLDHIEVSRYVPVDISGDHLQSSCNELQKQHPDLNVKPIVADFTQPIPIGESPNENKLGFFPGSTIGNFSPEEARSFLANAKTSLGNNGRLLIGVDTKKSPYILHNAYNDNQGITARFNLNILERINREIHGDFDTSRFEHYAFYNASKGCIEMHLVCLEKHTVHIDGIAIDFEAGESIHTENSYKYTPDDFSKIAQSADWTIEKLWLAKSNLFSIYLLS